jgi:hypothetical protein
MYRSDLFQSQSKTKFVPAHWIVTVSAADHATGQSVCLVQHQCSSRLHGSTLLTELREVLADLAELVPGLSVAGYEVAEAVEVFTPLSKPGEQGPEVLAALSTALPAGRDAAWWAQAIGQGRPSEQA